MHACVCVCLCVCVCVCVNGAGWRGGKKTKWEQGENNWHNNVF